MDDRGGEEEELQKERDKEVGRCWDEHKVLCCAAGYKIRRKQMERRHVTLKNVDWQTGSNKGAVIWMLASLRGFG